MPKAKKSQEKAKMAQKTVDDIFASLEKVFANEIEFDDALMELDLHTAQVRKSYPNLFEVLKSSRSNKVEIVQVAPLTMNQFSTAMTDFQRQWLEAVSKLLQSNPTTIYRSLAAEQQSSQIQETKPLDDVPIYKYSEWVVKQMPDSTPGQRWAIRWDIPNVPMPNLTQPILTLRRPEGDRIRFQVVGSRDDENIFELNTLKILPPAS
jgi:hypothetical protein